MSGMGKWVKYVRNLFILMAMCMVLSSEITVQAATPKQKEACKQEILEIYYSGDTSAHYITWYNVSVDELLEIYDELHDGEGRIIMGAYMPDTGISYTYSRGIVRKITLSNPGTGALTRYEKMITSIDTIMDGMEADMTDLDKVLYLHDALVELVSYGGNGNQKYMAGGALGEKLAVCSGYAKALNVLLSEIGLETDYVEASTINHGWSYVKIDGEWYHIDPTWDDTRSPQSGKTSRMYLLKNDAEMDVSHGASNPLKVEEESDSSKFSDWFVHSVVGKMCYENGMWYYVDQSGDYIMRSDIEGSIQEIAADCSKWNRIELIDVSGKEITIKADGSLQVITEGTIDVQPDTEDAEESESNATGDNTQKEDETPFITSVDLNDFSNWRSGMFHNQSGKYVSYGSRICLNFYVKCDAGTKYTVTLSDSSYQVLIREMNVSGNMIISNNLKDGAGFVTNQSTDSLAISLYNPGNSLLCFKDYDRLFANGFELKIESDSNETNETVDTESGEAENSETKDTVDNETSEAESKGPLQLETLDFTDFSNWRSGIYHWNTGKYMEYSTRICLVDYVTFSGDSYQAQISDTSFKMLIRELDENGNFIKSTTLSNGMNFMPQANTIYLAIGIYRDAEYGLNFEEYRNMFEAGFYAKLVAQ